MSDPRVKRFGRDVGAVWPNDRSQLFVECDLLEIGEVRERLEDAAPPPGGEVDFSFGTVLEGEMKTMLSDDIDGCHVNEIGHDHILGEACDAFERLSVPCANPVCLELSSMQSGPLPDES